MLEKFCEINMPFERGEKRKRLREKQLVNYISSAKFDRIKASVRLVAER